MKSIYKLHLFVSYIMQPWNCFSFDLIWSQVFWFHGLFSVGVQFAVLMSVMLKLSKCRWDLHENFSHSEHIIIVTANCQQLVAQLSWPLGLIYKLAVKFSWKFCVQIVIFPGLKVQIVKCLFYVINSSFASITACHESEPVK